MKATIHNIIYFLALGAIAVCMNVSVWTCNLAWVLLLANWVADWAIAPQAHRREILKGFRTNRLLQAFLVLVGLQAIGLLWSSNLSFGLDQLRKSLPLLAVPMVLLTVPPPTPQTRLPRFRHAPLSGLGIYLAFYLLGIVAACTVGLVRYLTLPDLPYRDIVPFLSHIRFSLNLCLAIGLLLWQCSRTRRTWLRVVDLALAAFFLIYIFILQSYTGVVILVAMAVVAAIRSRSKPAIALVATLLTAVLGVSAYYVHDYYHVDAPPQQDNHFIESGHYLFNDVDMAQLEQQWPTRSAMPLDSVTPNGFSIRPALLRYLNASGLTKDSLGLAQLTPDDIAAIERGVANPAYLHPLSLRRMYAVILFEIETSRHFHTVKGFTMLQRFELWRNGWQVFLQHPLIGTGTGDVVDACHAQLALNQSPLAGTSKHAHNQYLTFLLSFGILGFALIVAMFLRAFRAKKEWVTPLALVLTIFLISCLTEDTLETLAGDMFFCLFTCLFYPCSNTTPSPTASE